MTKLKKLIVVLFAVCCASVCAALVSASSCNSSDGHTTHTWDSGTATTPATCTEDGVMTYTCTVCGETKTETIEATGHSWNGGVETKAATCTEEGVTTYTCSVCNQTKTEPISITEHTYGELVSSAAATCGNNGHKSYYQCSVCEKYFDEDKVETTLEALTIVASGNHIYDDGVVVSHASTTNGEDIINGQIKYTCKVCGHEKFEEYTEDDIVAIAGGTQSAAAAITSGNTYVTYVNSQDDAASGTFTPVNKYFSLSCGYANGAAYTIKLIYGSFSCIAVDPDGVNTSLGIDDEWSISLSSGQSFVFYITVDDSQVDSDYVSVIFSVETNDITGSSRASAVSLVYGTEVATNELSSDYTEEWFTFTPAETACYHIVPSANSGDMTVYAYHSDTDFSKVSVYYIGYYYNSDTGYGYQLTAGMQYYFKVGTEDEEGGSVSFTLKEKTELVTPVSQNAEYSYAISIGEGTYTVDNFSTASDDVIWLRFTTDNRVGLLTVTKTSLHIGYPSTDKAISDYYGSYLSHSIYYLEDGTLCLPVKALGSYFMIYGRIKSTFTISFTPLGTESNPLEASSEVVGGSSSSSSSDKYTTSELDSSYTSENGETLYYHYWTYTYKTSVSGEVSFTAGDNTFIYVSDTGFDSIQLGGENSLTFNIETEDGEEVEKVFYIFAGNTSGSGQYIFTFSGNAWTVTFSTDYGTTTQQVVSKNGTVTAPAEDPVDSNGNLIFDGWYADSDCTEKFDFSTLITSDTTIYAGWTNSGTSAQYALDLNSLLDEDGNAENLEAGKYYKYTYDGTEDIKKTISSTDAIVYALKKYDVELATLTSEESSVTVKFTAAYYWIIIYMNSATALSVTDYVPDNTTIEKAADLSEELVADETQSGHYSLTPTLANLYYKYTAAEDITVIVYTSTKAVLYSVNSDSETAQTFGTRKTTLIFTLSTGDYFYIKTVDADTAISIHLISESDLNSLDFSENSSVTVIETGTYYIYTAESAGKISVSGMQTWLIWYGTSAGGSTANITSFSLSAGATAIIYVSELSDEETGATISFTAS